MLDARSELVRCRLEDAAFWTLTLDHRVRSHGREDANREIATLWRRLYARLVAHCRRSGWTMPRYFWIREAHRDGFPHLHLVVVHRELARMLAVRDAELAGHDEVRGDDRTLAPGWLRDLGRGAGFGDRFDASLARSREALASYAAKVTSQIDDAELAAVEGVSDVRSLAGEMSKGSQVPEMLPRHCRSYGYSRRFIPPRERSEEWTGWIEDELGRPMGSQARNLEHAERRAEKCRRKCPGPVYDPANPMAYFPRAIDAQVYAEGEGPGRAQPIARTYVLRGDDWRFERRRDPDDEAMREAMGAPPAESFNKAAAAATALRAAALVRGRANLTKVANNDGFEGEPWAH